MHQFRTKYADPMAKLGLQISFEIHCSVQTDQRVSALQAFHAWALLVCVECGHNPTLTIQGEVSHLSKGKLKFYLRLMEKHVELEASR